jgi:thioredoxin-related protein
MRKTILVSILALILQTSKAQIEEAPSPIKWYTIEQAQALAAKQPRPMLIDVYTDWCGWCKHMMQTTFTNPNLANYIQTNFYPVRFDGETNDTITFQGKKWTNTDFVKLQQTLADAKKNGQIVTSAPKKTTHDLAKHLLNNALSYPTIVYVDLQGNLNPVPGFMDANTIEPLLIYFSENLNQLVPFFDFQKYYYFTFPKVYEKAISELKPNEKPDTTGVVKWYTMKQAMDLYKQKPKKIFIDLNVNWRISCAIMEKTTYRQKQIAKLLNENFYPVRFDGMSKEEIELYGTKFINEGVQHPFHQLAVNLAVANDKINFPTIAFFDETGKLITRVNEYLSPSNAEAFISYITTDAYKTQKWPDYQQSYKPIGAK